MPPKGFHCGAVWVALCLGTIVAAQGCVQDQTVVADRSLKDAERQAEAMVREARLEADALRAELAATRIAAAKQEAEVQQLRRDIEDLRQTEARLRAASADLTRTNAEREEAQRQALATKEAELMALRAEKDRLVQSVTELQAKLALLLERPQSAADTTMTRDRLKELESTVAQLTVKVAQLKKNLAGKKAAQSSATPPSTTEPLPTGSALLLDVGQVLSIRVKRGDSLWSLARQYGVSVADLKAANHLQEDQLQVGQCLTIPLARSAGAIPTGQ